MNTQIPDFDEHGHLPPGIYTVDIDAVVKRFGGSKSLKRSQLTKNLKQFYNFVKYHATEVYIDGSYTTQKLAPSDIDMIVILLPEFLGNTAAHFRFSDFSNGYAKYKLHIYSFVDGVHNAERAYYFNLFTHSRLEDNGYEKGIVRLECKK